MALKERSIRHMALQYRYGLIVMAFSLVLGACTQEADTTTTSDGAVEPTSTSESSEDPATTTPTGDLSDATIVVAIEGDIDNFDPHTQPLVMFDYTISNTVLESLVRLDPVTLQVAPRLAESVDVNDAATEFTFTLPEGVVFHDGTPLDSEAVVASLERAADNLLAPTFANVSSYQTPDDLTVVITLSQPNAAFLDRLSDASIISPNSFEDTASMPIGTGPFQFVSWTPNESIKLERFEDYRGEQPAFQALEFRPIPDEQVALTNLQAGEVDVVVIASPTLAAQAESVEDIEVSRPPSTTSEVLIELMGVESPLVDDVRLRRALAYALDKEAVREIVYRGQGDLFWRPITSASWAYEPIEGPDFDLERARELVEEAGADGLTLTIEVLSSFPESEQLARVWQQDLAKIGINLEIEVSELSVWLDRYLAQNYDLTWNAMNVSGDPNTYWDVIAPLHLNQMWDRPDVEALIDEAVSTSDKDERVKAYLELDRIHTDDMPIIVVQSRPLASLVATDRVDGYLLTPLGWGWFEDMRKISDS